MENKTKIYIILRNGELYHGVNKKAKSVKAYTSRGVAEGVVKRDAPRIATEEFRGLDIKYDEGYEIILNTVLSQFEIKEVEI